MGSDGEDAAFLSAAYGLTLDQWQQNILGDWMGIKKDGRWAASRCGLAVPRQNGKNAVLEARELMGMVSLGEKFLHTAHETKTSRKAFVRLVSFFDNPRQFPELADMVESIRRTNGQEAILLKNGGSCEFVARSRGSGRGFTVDCLVLDEAQELTEDQLAALLPTISASPTGNPSTIMVGTPPADGMDGEAFTRLRTAGVEGKDNRLSWTEYSAEGAVDLDDVELWAATNPALGIRLNLDTIMDERAALDDDTFARERLGMWHSGAANRVITAEAWQLIADPNMADGFGEAAFAVDVSPDRSIASLLVASHTGDGIPTIGVVESRRGPPDWVVERIAGSPVIGNVRAVVIDGAGPAASLIDPLRARGINVTVTGARQMASACGGIYDAVMAQQVRHFDQPQLNAALAVARKRKLGDAWAWSRASAESDITPLVAATLALWGLGAAEAKRPMRKAGAGRVRVFT